MDTKRTRVTLAGGRGVTTTCRYDAYRRGLLDSLRARWQGPYADNASLIVMDALDRLLVEEGLLPADAPLFSSLRSEGPVMTVAESMDPA